MFTGIVAGMGTVIAVNRQQEHLKLSIQFPEVLCRALVCGASVAIDGVCLTVTSIDATVVSFDVIGETLARTALGQVVVNQNVNLERALCYGMEVGGHLVEGHIVGCGTLLDIQRQGSDYSMKIACPEPWMKYIFSKGCIALHGVSLTVGEVWPALGHFCVHLIPETLRVTNLSQIAPGAPIHIEIDTQQKTIVDTVERLLMNSASCSKTTPLEIGKKA
jgi:riboflavin synthase